MAIPAATLDTIKSALAASRVTAELTCYEPGAPEAPQAHRETHHWIKFSTKLDNIERGKVALLLSGMNVRQDGIFVLIPTGDNGASEPEKEVEDSVETPAPPAPEPKVADGAVVEAAPDAVSDAEKLQKAIEAVLPDLRRAEQEREQNEAAAPARSRKVSTIKLDILPADLDALLNDITVTILSTGFNGDKLNVAYYREVQS